MKKLMLVFGVGIGFLLGSRAGTGPYQAVEKKVHSLLNRPEVGDAVGHARDAASETVAAAVDRVNAKLPSPATQSMA